MEQDGQRNRALPNDGRVTLAQAFRLAKLSGLAAEELAGQTLSAVERRLSFVLAPELLGLRRISGRVVQRNLATGALEPIPQATVHVEDTLSSFLLYSPPQWADWSWLLPSKLHREEIATTTTDARGYFSVCIPRWEIEAISRWRQGRIRFNDFSRPRLRDIVRELDSDSPSEPPEAAIRKPGFLARCRRKVGRVLAEEIGALLRREGTAMPDNVVETLLETPVAPHRPPVLDDRFARELKENVAAHGLAPELVGDLAFGRSIDPVWRNGDVMLKLWTLLRDVPDITFRVTQGDAQQGGEQLIYSDGFFGVPWNQGPIPDLTLTSSILPQRPAVRGGSATIPAPRRGFLERNERCSPVLSPSHAI